MNIFFGKISKHVDIQQIIDGYYISPKGSSWFNGLDIGDYAFVIGNGKIQLWKAREWVLANGEQTLDRLYFDILIADLGIKISQLVRLKYFELTSGLIVKTSRSTAKEKKAFFPIAYLEDQLTEEILLNPSIYSNPDFFREIFVFDSKEEVTENSLDLQMYFEDSILKLYPIAHAEGDLHNKFMDNLPHEGKGQKRKDKTLSIVRARVNRGKNLSHKLSIQNIYDAFMCKYNVTTKETSYWVVNAFDDEYLEYCLDNDIHLMQYQYNKQNNSKVSIELGTVIRIKEGDKVLLYKTGNCYYAHGTFVKNNAIATKTMYLKEQIDNGLVNTAGEIITYKDAPCFYEDLSIENDFGGEFGQRLCVDGWEDVNKGGIWIKGIASHVLGVTTNTINQLKDATFFDMVKDKLSTETKGIEGYELLENCVDVLGYKQQIILQGPPGTGKTYSAKDLAEYLIYGKISIDKDDQKDNLENTDQFELIQFHPSYTYEDFVRGISAKSNGKDIEYITENKTLAKFADLANLELLKTDPKKYILVIDEINRANLPSVLGELIYALEYRGKKVNSMYELKEKGKGNEITLPKNLYIIGTMNTADRSVGHIDYAIRRRFAFIDMLPEITVINDEKAKGLFRKVAALFVNDKKENSDYLAGDFDWKDVQIGHSYFLAKDEKELGLKLKYEIKPILNEYVKDGILKGTAKAEIAKLTV
jgi:hypothetical protein